MEVGLGHSMSPRPLPLWHLLSCKASGLPGAKLLCSATHCLSTWWFWFPARWELNMDWTSCNRELHVTIPLLNCGCWASHVCKEKAHEHRHWGRDGGIWYLDLEIFIFLLSGHSWGEWGKLERSWLRFGFCSCKSYLHAPKYLYSLDRLTLDDDKGWDARKSSSVFMLYKGEYLSSFWLSTFCDLVKYMKCTKLYLQRWFLAWRYFTFL